LVSSRDHFCSENATTPSLCIAKLHVDVNKTKVLSAEQKCFFGEFMSPETVQRTYVVTWSARYFCPNL